MKIKYLLILLSVFIFFLSCKESNKSNTDDNDWNGKKNIESLDVNFFAERIIYQNDIDLENLQDLYSSLSETLDSEAIETHIQRIRSIHIRIQNQINKKTEPKDDYELYKSVREFRNELFNGKDLKNFPYMLAGTPDYGDWNGFKEIVTFETACIERDIIGFLNVQVIFSFIGELDNNTFTYLHSEPLKDMNDTVVHTLIIGREIGQVPEMISINGKEYSEEQVWEKKSLTKIKLRQGELNELLVKVNSIRNENGANVYIVNTKKE